MSSPLGRNALQKLLNFRVRAWFKTEIPRLAEDIVAKFRTRNEVLEGGVIIAGGSVTDKVIQVTSSPAVTIASMLNGRLMATIAALSNTDILTKAGSVEEPIFSDGASAGAIDLDTDETAYVTLIVTNSDGAGDAAETDGGAPKLIAVIAGTSTTYMDEKGHLSSQDIQDALDAADSVHDGVTGWAHVAQILWDENGGVPAITITMNRNNVVSEA